MPLHFCFTMVQKKWKMTKNSNQGGGVLPFPDSVRKAEGPVDHVLNQKHLLSLFFAVEWVDNKNVQDNGHHPKFCPSWL